MFIEYQPDGKQVKSEYLGRFSTNSSFANGFIDGAIESISFISGAKMIGQLTSDPNFRKQFFEAIKTIASNPKEFLMKVAKDKVETYKAFFAGTATDQQMYDIGNEFAGLSLGIILGGTLLKLVKEMKDAGIKNTLKVAKDAAKKSIKKLCFVAGTLVLTATGLKSIEEIKVGDKVWSYNEETKIAELKEVVALSKNTTNQLIEIEAGNETIVCTPEHPFYIGEKWIEAKNLKIGDQLTLKNNTFVKISKLNPLEKEVTVYNFEVTDNHNYYVSQLEVLVHNNCDFDLKVSKFGNKIKNSTFDFDKIKKMSTETLDDTIDMFKESIQTRKKEWKHFESSGKGDISKQKGHAQRITYEEKYLRSLEKERKSRR